MLMQAMYAVRAMRRLGVTCACTPGQVQLVDLGARVSFHLGINEVTLATPASRWMARVAAESVEAPASRCD